MEHATENLATGVKPKRSKFAILFMAVMALAFSYVITKEVVIPSWIIAASALAGGIVLFTMGIHRPEVVTYVLVAYLPFSKVLVGGFGGLAMALNLTNLLMLFIFMVWMTGKFAHDEPLWLSSPLNVPVALFILMGFLSVMRGTYYGTGYGWFAFVEFKRWITPILMFFLVLNTVKDRVTIRNVVIIVIVVTTIVGLMAIYDYINVGESSLEKARIGGIAEHSNSLAAFFNYYMFLPLGFFLLSKKKIKSWLLLIPFLIQFRGIMVTFSRGGYMAFALGLYAITFFRSKMLFFLLLFATVFAMINPFFLPAGIRYRMGQTFTKPVSYTQAVSEEKFPEEALETSARTRVDVWKGAIAMIKEQPLLGVGYGLFYPMISYYWSQHRPIDAHNTYLIIAAEMGIPTLLIFLFIVFQVIRNTYLLYRTTQDPFSKAVALGFLGGLFALLMSNMFGSRLDSQEVSSYFWILSALIMRLMILDQKEKTVPTVFRAKSQMLDAAWNLEGDQIYD